MVEKAWEMVGGKEGVVSGRNRKKGEGLYRVYLAKYTDKDTIFARGLAMTAELCASSQISSS